jgi:DNA-binding Lrp family transcriptional regulator
VPPRCGQVEWDAKEAAFMVNAVVLLKIRNDRINEVAEALVELDGVSEVYSVAGQYDLVAILRAPNDDRIAALVTEHMLKIEGTISSETLIAFRAFSKYDLERMFSVGMD